MICLGSQSCIINNVYKSAEQRYNVIPKVDISCLIEYCRLRAFSCAGNCMLSDRLCFNQYCQHVVPKYYIIQRRSFAHSSSPEERTVSVYVRTIGLLLCGLDDASTMLDQISDDILLDITAHVHILDLPKLEKACPLLG